MNQIDRLLYKVLELDIAYLDTFTNRMNTSWGHLFYNEQQPDYYDANHAHIYQIPSDPKSVVSEVVNFYSEKGLIPRFYIYNFEQQSALIKELESCIFQIEELVSPVQLWNQEVKKHEKNQKITFEKVTKENYEEALTIECSIKEFGGGEVREKAFAEEFHHPAFTHYLLRYDGVACSTACIFEYEDQGRIESVATLEEYRGKGLIGELIYYIQAEAKSRGLNHLWIFPINEKIERVYAKYGFRTIGKYTMGHAFLGGKGIKEIQEG